MNEQRFMPKIAREMRVGCCFSARRGNTILTAKCCTSPEGAVFVRWQLNHDGRHPCKIVAENLIGEFVELFERDERVCGRWDEIEVQYEPVDETHAEILENKIYKREEY